MNSKINLAYFCLNKSNRPNQRPNISKTKTKWFKRKILQFRIQTKITKSKAHFIWVSTWKISMLLKSYVKITFSHSIWIANLKQKELRCFTMKNFKESLEFHSKYFRNKKLSGLFYKSFSKYFNWNCFSNLLKRGISKFSV